jgi:MerR family mercuric resistance operon transcriptional regulator
MTVQRSYKRGEVARLSGVGAETLRYYEKVGLLPEPPRTAARYREYPPEILTRLRFIQSSKKLGFSLEEIRSLLKLKDEKDRSCGEVRERAVMKIAEVNQKIEELQWIRDDLEALVERCDGQGKPGDCAIFTTLEDKHKEL